ncbi:hypothetical protein [Rhizobium leguminosarum]|uniref:hypothetical protein n=1 Tax=Rhizobium leguminosarum TaxID=384 RepID=UPI001C911C53|nr:hypothetical protein [Rhizobium leguminosarum]MBY2950944.1 hypothetical protein [Rhizobium leguminosarum]
MTTTETVYYILTKEGGYRPLGKPIKIGSQAFDFTYVLVASERANDLVIVIELTGASDDAQVTRSVLAFTRALDVLGSRRSVTAVLTSGQADNNLVNSISRVCRVLPVGAPSGPLAEEVVRDWLAVLLPLKSPPPVEHLADWKASLEKQLENHNEPAVGRFVLLAEEGTEAVERALALQISTLADQMLEDGAEQS